MHPENASTDPRRQSALILARVEQHQAHAARLLGSAPGLTRELVLGVLRWQRTLDSLIAPFLRRPLDGLDVAVRAILRVGLYEAKRLSTPVPVAVAEAVRVAKLLAPSASGLVNAVLRRAAAGEWPAPDDASTPLGVRVSHPEWLVQRWQSFLGCELAEEAMRAAQAPAPLMLVSSLLERDGLLAQGCELVPHPWVDGVEVVHRGAELVARSLAAGRGYAMDAIAVVVARLVPDVEGLCVDLAAAPGGKSLVLSTERKGRNPVAFDHHVGRTLMMRRNLGRAVKAVPVVVADAACPPLRSGSCGAVLLDAPCSGTGTLRRHPEIRWRLQEADLVALAVTQRLLAVAAASLLAPGGYLLYSTCSVEPEENERVLAGLGLDPVDLGASLPPLVPRVVRPSGGVVIPPSEHGDGFTVHLLRRSA